MPKNEPQAHEVQNAFYMVWCRSGQTPIKQHTSYDEAVAEAERLLVRHPGEEFVVLKSASSIKRGPATWVGHF